MSPKPTYEELVERVKVLEAAYRSHERNEAALRELNHALADRVKKLNCLYEIAKLRENNDLSIEELYQGIVDLIPPAWQYADIASARLVIGQQIFASRNFKPSPWKQTADIVAKGQKMGQLEVCYAAPKPASDEGPFLREERKLIDIIAERIGRIVEHRRTETALFESEKQCHNLFENAPIGLFRSAIEGDLVSVNPAFAKMFGYNNPAEMLALVKNLATQVYFDPTQRKKLIAMLMNQDMVLNFENRYRRKDGSTFMGNLHVRVTRNAADAPEYLEGFIEDITERKKAETALRENEKLLKDIFDAIQDGISLLDTDFNILRANKTMEQWYASETPLVGQKCYRAYHGRCRRCEICPAIRALDSGRLQMDIVPLVESRAIVGWLELYAFPVLDAEGNPEGVVEYVRNVTDRMNAERALRESEERFRATFEQAAMGICHIDTSGNYLRVNRRFCKMLAYTREELVGLSFAEITNPEDLAISRAYMEQALAGQINQYNHEKRFIRKDGLEVWTNVTVALVRELCGDPKYFISVVEDISERKKMELELTRLATTDSLTGILNRRHFFELGTRELDRARRYKRHLSLLLMDIDHFKSINDTYGHAAGDEALKTLANVCQRNLRKNDLFGRVGGEEFAVILPETGASVAMQLAERLRQRLADTIIVSKPLFIELTVSIGVTTFKPKDPNLDALMQRADRALYQAKRGGRNRVVSTYR